MSYFKDFPVIQYRFGDDDQPPVYYQNLSSYSDLIDQVADGIIDYQYYTILDGDRPDTLSYKLYGTTDFYWTFFLLNEELRESGWPLPVMRAYQYVEESYPNWVFSVEGVTSVPEAEANILATTLLDGTVVDISPSTGMLTATVVSKNLDLGQIVLQPNELFSKDSADTDMLNATTIRYIGSDGKTYDTDALITKTQQYNAVHHYKNTSGDIVDIDPYDLSSISGLLPVTYSDRMIGKNDGLRKIKVFRKSLVSTIVKDFHSSFKE